MTFIKNFLKDEDGASAIEYAILVAVVATALVAAGTFINFDAIFATTEGKVTNAVK